MQNIDLITYHIPPQHHHLPATEYEKEIDDQEVLQIFPSCE